MEESVIYGLLKGQIDKWRQAALCESADIFLTKELELVRELEQKLDDSGRDQLAALRLVIENKMDFIARQTGIKTLNLGIKIGTQIEIVNNI